MYVAKIPNRSSPPAYLLRESVRNGQKVATRTIANLTDWTPERRLALERCLKGEFDHLPIGAESNLQCSSCFGVLHAIKSVSDRLGISEVLGDDRIGKLLQFLVMARIAHQGSRLSAVRWSQQHAVRETLGLMPFDEDDLYIALDHLDERHARVEDALYQRHISHGGAPPALVLYDVTSSYFEGQDNELAEFGYNRDGKHGKKQIVIGLLAAPDGEPLSVTVFRGSTSDPITVPKQIATLRDRFGITEILFIGDRGMVKAKGKEALSDAGFRYLTALTDPQVRKRIQQDIIQTSLFDTNLHEVVSDGKRLVLIRNEETLRRERHRRDDKVKELQARLALANKRLTEHPHASVDVAHKKLSYWVKRHKLSSFASLAGDAKQRIISLTIDQALRCHDEELDGCFVLETDAAKTALTTEQVRDRYLDLTKVERDFRSMKTGLLEVRPIYVRKAERTRAHVLISMLALKVEREMERCLVAAFGTTHHDPAATTLPDALNALSRWCFLTMTSKAGSMTILPRLDEQQQRIMDALQVTSLGATRLTARNVGRRKKRK